jgi:cobalt-zinc-cadmium efflux system outer membrane protein
LEALRRRDAAQATAQAEELRLRSEVLQMADLLQARKDEVEALRREVLPGAQSAYEAAKTGFELGKFSFLMPSTPSAPGSRSAASTSPRWRRSIARLQRSTASSAPRQTALTGKQL